MRALILTHGTRGDVQPFAALALALGEAGHDVLLGAPAGLASVAEPYGIPYAPLDDGANKLLDDPEIREAVETNYRGLRGKMIMLKVIRHTKPLFAPVLDDMAAAAGDGADIVVHHPGMPGQHIAEKLGVPAVPACLQPGWVPTGAFPNPMLPVRLPKALNRASYQTTRRVTARTMAGATDRWRTETFGLPKRRGRHDILRGPDGAPTTVLQGFSPRVLPAPPDYPPTVHTTGYWYLPTPPGWGPTPALADFLATGEPPVYLGFGSMAGTDPGRIGRVVAGAVRLAGVRAIVATGWGGIDADFPDDVLVLDQAPHAWLFPRMAAIVHHGGSGTTAAALASGRPQIVCPFVADQPFWARQTYALGVAPAPQPQRHLTPDTLAAAIHRVRTDQAMRRRASDLGEVIRGEDGAATAVRILEQTVSRADAP